MKVAKRLDNKIAELQDNLKRTRVFLDLLTAIRDSGFTLEALAEEAGVAPATLYFWVAEYTKHPRIDTIVKVANVIGMDLRLYKIRTVKPVGNQRRIRPVDNG